MEADNSSSGRRRASAAGLWDGSGVVVVVTGSVVVVTGSVVVGVASVAFLTTGIGLRDSGGLKP